MKERKGGSKMFEIRYAFNDTDKEYEKLSPPALIRKMFEKTDGNGILVVPERTYLTGRSMAGNKWLRCEMDWTEDDVKKITREFRVLYKALLEASEMHPELDENDPDDGGLLSEEASRVRRRYLLGLGSSFDVFEKDIRTSVSRLIAGYPEEYPVRTSRRQSAARHLMSADPVPYSEEVFLYWRYDDHLKRAIRKVFGGGQFAFDVCVRMKRLYYMMAFPAPGRIADREARRLAAFMVLNKYCVRYSSFDTYDGYAVPLYRMKNVDAVREIISDPELYYPVFSGSVTDNGFSDLTAVTNADAEYGEDIIRAYDELGEYDDPGCHAIAAWLYHNKEINPKKINFEGFESSLTMPAGCPDFVIFPDKALSPDEDRAGIGREDVIDALMRFADAMGIDTGLVGRYKVPV
jgi:hypothetical protein